MSQVQTLSFIGFWSDRGRVREENEDSFYVPPVSLSPQLLQRKGYLCAVADGMGGHAKGEVASAIAVRRIAEEYYSDPNPDPEQSLRRAIQVANSEVYARAQNPEMAGMGTTAVVAVLAGNRVIVANVGDSRAYLISRGQAIQITRDHSWVQERVEEGRLTAEQARLHPQKNFITRALGTRPAVDMDVFPPAAEMGDSLLLCSDGLSNIVLPQEIARTVSSLSPAAAAKQLVALANKRGGPDNITAIVLSVAPEVDAVPRLRPSSRAPMLLGISAVTILSIFLLITGAFLSRSQANQVALDQETKVSNTQSPQAGTPSVAVAMPLTSAPSVPSAMIPTLPLRPTTARPTSTEAEEGAAGASPSSTSTPPSQLSPNPANPPGTPCLNQWTFLKETIPDDSTLNPNQPFTKTWQVKNSGSCTWNKYQLAFVSGKRMSAPEFVEIPLTLPDSEVELEVPMTSPSVSGKYTGNWQLRTNTGAVFVGDGSTTLWVTIQVLSRPPFRRRYHP